MSYKYFVARPHQEKAPYPITAEIANPDDPCNVAVADAITSGAPFPMARNVTPATLDDSRNRFEISDSAGRKSKQINVNIENQVK